MFQERGGWDVAGLQEEGVSKGSKRLEAGPLGEFSIMHP